MYTLCPDCDTPLPESYHSYNKRKNTYRLSKAGKLVCSECNTTLVISLINGEFNLRIKELKTPFKMPKGHKQYDLTGMPIECDPGHEIAPKVTTIHALCCVACQTEIQSTINTIRVKVVKGIMRIQRPTEDLDPAGNPIMKTVRIPTYETGRLCKVCQSDMRASGHTDPETGEHITAPLSGEYEVLHERIKPHKRLVVTRGSIKSMNLQLEIEKSAQRFIDLGDIVIAAPPEVPEEVDVSAYRALHRMGRSRSRGKEDRLVDFNERGR